MIYIDDSYIKKTLKKRDRNAHKGDFGKILIFAGSMGMAGAAVLCGRAALKTGSGLVQFLLPEMPCAIYPVLQTAVPEATCVAFSDGLNLDKYDAIACGSGIGQSDEAMHILRYILQYFSYSFPDDSIPSRQQYVQKPKQQNTRGAASAPTTLVLDADALNLISKSPELAELVNHSQANIIMTPHIGETKRLLHSAAEIAGPAERKKAACDLAEKYNCIAVLKGAGTLVAVKTDSRFLIYENTTGNPGMATAGSGDSLSGIITSLAGQNYAAPEAARMGVFLHGKAGDIAAQKLGEMSVTAGDITDNIPCALKDFY